MARPLAPLLALLALAPALAGGADGVGATGEVRVAAASDLRHALDELVAAFRAEHPGTEVKVTYGASGILFAQLQGGAPYDLFFSADERLPRRLADAGQAVPESVTTYGVGRLVLWLPASSPVDAGAGLAALRDPRVKRIAVASPVHAPYGQAADAALRAAGLHDAVADRLVVAENAAQAAQFAESGNADAALLPLSTALAPALARAGRHVLVPPSLYPPPRQAAVVMARARGNVAAAALLRFAVAREGRTILERWGLAAPER